MSPTDRETKTLISWIKVLSTLYPDKSVTELLRLIPWAKKRLKSAPIQ